MNTLRVVAVLAALLTSAPEPTPAQSIPTPESHFGFAMGTDRELARWDGILEYFTHVADASDRVRVDTLGASTLGNPFVVVTLSAPGNLARLDEIRRVSAELAEGRASRTEAEAFAARVPATVVINHNIHSTEIASSQTSVDLVYLLASGDDARIREILDNVVTVLIPSANPDGQIMVVDWYRRNLDTPFERARMPYLYHSYAGHDNNRDFFQGNLVETRHWMDLMFRTAYPQVYLDQHQMGGSGPRMFVPPYPDPMDPKIHPLQWQSIRFMGGGIVTDLQREDKQGVITGAMYRIWGQEGALTGRHHNIVSLLTESASANIASPDTVTMSELEGSANRARDIDRYGFTMSFVDPWWGGVWRMGDIVEYQTIAALSVLKQTARFQDDYLLGRWQMASETIERAQEDGPFAFVIPAHQDDPVTAADLARRLAMQGIEVHQAAESFEAHLGQPPIPDGGLPDYVEHADGDADSESESESESEGDESADDEDEDEQHGDDESDEHESSGPQARSFPSGSWIVFLAQNSRAAILDLMQIQDRELQREYPGGPYLRSYDGAAYTMPMQMGVEAVQIDEPFDVDVRRATQPFLVAPAMTTARSWYGLSTSVNASYRAANRLMAMGIPVSRSENHLLVPAGHAGAAAALDELRVELGLSVAADPESGGSAMPMSRSRVGLYQGWAGAMDEGWTRLLLEEYEFDVTPLTNEDVRDDDLPRRFDVVILPSEISLTRLIEGASEDDAPPGYAGGIGMEGVENLERFVQGGGTLVTLDRGDAVVLEHFDVPVRDALEGLGGSDLFTPSSLFRVELDGSHPLTTGSPSEVAAKWAGGRAYEPHGFGAEGSSAQAVGRWAADPDRVLLSGLLVGAEHLAGKAAIVDVTYGQGRIFMYGFRVQHRAQTAGTFKLLFNALLRRGSRTAT